MLRRRISAAVITLVICFLSTSPIIGDCRRLLGADETPSSHEGGDSSSSSSDGEGIPREYYNSSLTAAAAADSSLDSQMMPPMDLLLQIGRATNMEEFLKFVDKSSIDPRDNLVNGAATMGLERSSAKQYFQAGCIPGPTVVKLLPEGVSATSVFFPSCIRVNRCGGCCFSSTHSCQAIETETLTVPVTLTNYKANGKLDYKGKVPVLVEEHTKCGCKCIIQPKDCNPQQLYDQKNCQCVCQNMDERNKCLQQSEIKVWDPKTCRCGCLKPVECTTGAHFDPFQCQCVKFSPYSNLNPAAAGRTDLSTPSNNNYNKVKSSSPNPTSLEDRRKYILKAQPAVPVPSSDTTKYSTFTN